MQSNISGGGNTADGYYALQRSTYGYYNTAIGHSALLNNTSGTYNTGVGYQALTNNSTGNFNTAIGSTAMYGAGSANDNTAVGFQTLYYISTGEANTAIGNQAMLYNAGGSYNTAVGFQALHQTSNSQYNTAFGYMAGATYDLGYNNTFIGAFTGASMPNLYNIVALGYDCVVPYSSTARIGNAATTSIGGYADWTNISDGRFKKEIKEDVKGLEFIMKLRPVTYRLDVTGLSKRLNENQGKEWNAQMKQAIADKEKIVYSGFIAQEVEKAATEVGYDFSGVDKPQTDDGLYGLRYSQFVVPITKAIQEQQHIIEDLQKQNDQLKTINAEQKRKYEDLLQRVSSLSR
jgi:hypothetical protein